MNTLKDSRNFLRARAFVKACIPFSTTSGIVLSSYHNLTVASQRVKDKELFGIFASLKEKEVLKNQRSLEHAINKYLASGGSHEEACKILSGEE